MLDKLLLQIPVGAELSVRIDDRNPDHNIWDNHGVFWVHFMMHLPDYTSVRFRKSLRTRDRSEARRVRDQLFARLGQAEISADLHVEGLAA